VLWDLLMSDYTLLGPWIRRFLLEHVVAERNLGRNTQHSYRDALGLLIPFVARMQKSLSIVSLWSISRRISSADFSPTSSPR
jgi:integrase/recombinase XerD